MDPEQENLKHLLQVARMLQLLISTPSFSGMEQETAKLIATRLRAHKFNPQFYGNNVVLKSPGYDITRPTLLLCSHHDTVKPVSGYTRDPYMPFFESDANGRTRLYGLGSNDAGAALVSMMDAFYHFYERTNLGADLPFNILLALCAEEEITGEGGLSSILHYFPEIQCAIIGEPTDMEVAVGERGLLVLDGSTAGIAGHAARQTGVNAIYLAMEDIQSIAHYPFEKVSTIMGPISIQVTQINAGTQHNVIPDKCTFVVDIRTTDQYNSKEVLDLLQNCIKYSHLTPRNLRNKASVTPADHPLIKAVTELRLATFISPTASDWMRLDCPAIKMGPGSSPRSHSADEFIYLDELEAGFNGYINFISTLKNYM